jgi:hypothetical protein
MIVMKLGGASAQDAEAIGRVAVIVRELLQLEIFSSPKLRPTTSQVSGHEFTRAVQPKKNLGFSPCDKTPHQDPKAKFFLPDTARLKSCPDTCLGRETHIVLFNSASPIFSLRFSAPPRLRGGLAFLRASVPPWWGLSR